MKGASILPDGRREFDKLFTKDISVMYKNNIAEANVENEVTSWFCIEAGIKQGGGSYSVSHTDDSDRI